MPHLLANTRKLLFFYVRLSWRTKAFWVRALLCWIIGASFLMNDEVANYDMRLQVRGPRPTNTEVILIDVSERDWSQLEPQSRNVLRPLKEVLNVTDAYFWNPTSWERILSFVLNQQPTAVGVSFFFGENIHSPQVTASQRDLFENPRVVWGADFDSTGRVLVPLFATTYNSNIGIRGVRTDDDGIVRRFSTSPVQVPHLGIQLATLAHPDLAGYINRTYQQPMLINYSGGADIFKVVNFRDVMLGHVARDTFKDKIVLIGSLTSSIEQAQTPLGRMSRLEITANIVDNVVGQKTVLRAPTWVYVVILAFLMLASVWILLSYPQSVSLLVYLMVGVLWISLSVWCFDILKVWLPILSPLVQLVVTYVAFMSYQLALNEQKTWRLEQEQIYLSEIEQLKTNFVSMMSHDLKTPIAKIQAICDRLLASLKDDSFSQDIRSLRRSSDELHRYIQSILQISKVEAKDFKISKEVTDINDDIEKVIARIQPLANEKGIHVESTLEPLFSIEADPTLIQEVIHNLLENAVKYTPSGGKVRITSQEQDDNVVVIVEDTGPGIAPDEQNEIWGKFTRGRGLDMDIKGTGLGLYLVKYFIELHGGRIILNSALGQGTRIGFSIPIADESAA